METVGCSLVILTPLTPDGEAECLSAVIARAVGLRVGKTIYAILQGNARRAGVLSAVHLPVQARPSVVETSNGRRDSGVWVTIDATLPVGTKRKGRELGVT